MSLVLTRSLLQLANVLSNETLFYVCIIPFIIFFGSFAFILYPLRDQLHPTGAPPPPFLACSWLGDSPKPSVPEPSQT